MHPSVVARMLVVNLLLGWAGAWKKLGGSSTTLEIMGQRIAYGCRGGEEEETGMSAVGVCDGLTISSPDNGSPPKNITNVMSGNVTETVVAKEINGNRSESVCLTQTPTINKCNKLHRLLDAMMLLSPKTWLGILEIQDASDMVPFSFDTMLQGVWGVVLPLLMLWNINEMLSSKIPLLRLCLISPWCMACYCEIVAQLRSVWPVLELYATGRAAALPSAVLTLNQRLQVQRAYQTRRYDVYLPPPTLLEKDPNKHQRAVLFFPGALVPHTAYSEVASQLSDSGLVLVVASMEPLRLAHRALGSDLRLMQRIMKQVENRLALQNEKNVLNFEWTIMGHSMGSFAAMRLFDDLHRIGAGSRDGIQVSHKLVLWGMAAFVSFASDLTKHDRAQILIVQGADDHLLDMLQSRNAELKALFPKYTSIETIADGSHDGFGSYSYPAAAGMKWEDAKLRSDQQAEACRITAAFLL